MYIYLIIDQFENDVLEIKTSEASAEKWISEHIGATALMYGDVKIQKFCLDMEEEA